MKGEKDGAKEERLGRGMRREGWGRDEKRGMGEEVRVERSDEDNYQIKFVHVLKSLNFNQSSSCILSR